MHDRIDERTADRAKLEPDTDLGHLGSVLAIVADAIISVDVSQTILFFNRGAEQIFGYPADQVLGRSLDILLPERYRAAHRAHVQEFARSSTTARPMGERLEIRALRSDGQEFPAEASIAQTSGSRGPILTVVLRDVTEQKRAQLELAARERQLSEAQTIASIGSWTWDVETDVVNWSDELYRIYGLEVGSPIDFRTFSQYVHPEDRALVEEQVRAAMESGDPFELQHRIRRPDGTVRWLQGRGEVIRGGDGRVVRLAGTGQDITESRQASVRARRLAVEQAAREAAEEAERRMAFLARASVELASSLEYETTLRTVARLAVPEMADWCGVDLVGEDGSIQRLAIEHQDPEKVALIQRISERYPADPDAPYGAPEVIRTGKTELGRQVADEMLVAAAHDAEHLEQLRSLGLKSYVVAPLTVRERVLGAITFVRAESTRPYDEDDCLLVEDLARRAAVAIDNARLVRELAQAIQTKTDFMATVSHELRTPLNAIIGYTELLQDGIPSPMPTPAAAYIERIGLSAQHLLQLIDEILTFSRLQADREVVERSAIDLDSLIEEMQAIIGPLAEAKGLRFHVRRTGMPASLVTDPRKLRQILLNLLGNAVKFTDAGVVELGISASDGGLRFQVVDSGQGITAEERRQLFEPFWQGDQSRTRRLGGAGLGLAISDRFARLLGGEITVESTPGRGSNFTLSLPAEPPASNG